MQKALSCALCVLAALVMSVVSVFAQTDPQSVVLQTFETVSPAIGVTTTLDLSLRSHDDWALASVAIPQAADLSLRVHDDWPLPNRDAQTPLDLSPKSHDDWGVESH